MMNYFGMAKHNLVLPTSGLQGRFLVLPLLIALLILLVFSLPTFAQEATKNTAQENEPPAPEDSDLPEIPPLSEIIPLETKLSGLLDQLELNNAQLPDLTPVQKAYEMIEKNVAKISADLKSLRGKKTIRTAHYILLKQRLNTEQVRFEFSSGPLEEEIDQLGSWDLDWDKEKIQWDYWRSVLLKERSLHQLRATFDRADKTIATAQSIINQDLERLLKVQAKGGQVMALVLDLDGEVQSVIQENRQAYLLGSSPPIFSRNYFSQFNSEILKVTLDGLHVLSIPDRRFFADHGLVMALIFLLFVWIVTFAFRNREALKGSERWGFFGEKPISAALFGCCMISLIYFEFWGALPTVKLINMLVGGTGFVIILNEVAKVPWRKQAAKVILISFIITTFFITIGLPSAIFSLYVFFASALGVRFFLNWAKASAARGDSPKIKFFLRVAACLAVFIILAELWGKDGLATFIFISTQRSMAVLLASFMFIYLIRGALHWTFFKTSVWDIKQLRNDAAEIAQKIALVIQVVYVLVLLIPILLTAWDISESVPEAIQQFLGWGFQVHEGYVSVGMILSVWVVLYGTSIIAKVIPKVYLDEKFGGKEMDRGTRRSIGRLIQYSIFLIGFSIAVTLMGLDFTKLTIILSAFGVGIGFGLQSIVANFVSGLIMLFERPLREGDTIEVGLNWAQIKKIGLRSTTVETFEQADIIIPNSDLINNQVTNWTLTNRQVRLSVNVGVAYGSNLALVVDTLLACARKSDSVLKSPEPQVLFKELGDSSLDFELRVWVVDADTRPAVRSELYMAIDRSFNEAGIVIPFPQRVLHIQHHDNLPQPADAATVVKEPEVDAETAGPVEKKTEKAAVDPAVDPAIDSANDSDSDSD